MAKKNRQERRERRQARRAARQQSTNNQMQIQSEVVGAGTDTGNVRFTPSEISSGNIYKTTSSQIPGAGFAFTQGKPLGQEGIDRINKVLGYDPNAATAAAPGTETSGASTTSKKGKGRKKLTIRGVKVGKSLSGKEAMKLAGTGLGVRAIDKALAKGATIQGSAERRLTKGQLATPEQRLLGSVFDTQRQDMNGGLRGSGIPSSLDPRSKDVQALSGLGLEKGQRFLGATGSGAPILATKDMLGGTRGGGGGKGRGGGVDDIAEPTATADTMADETATGPILPEEEEEDTAGGLMTGSVEAGRSALGIKRRRSRAQRLRLAQLGTSRLNRLKIRSMLNLSGGLSGLV
jgi:hypothetical protein